MRNGASIYRILVSLALIVVLSGCAAGPAGPYYRVTQNHTENGGPFRIGPTDHNYILDLEDRTHFGLNGLPKTEDLLYNKGYDRVRKEKHADFSIEIIFASSVQDNPEVRAGNTLGGAMLGAATGALIGAAAAGEPATGAAIGAVGGGALGLVAPAATELVRIDMTVYSFDERTTTRKSATVDLASVPPPDVQYVIDNEVSRMLRSLPRR